MHMWSIRSIVILVVLNGHICVVYSKKHLKEPWKDSEVRSHKRIRYSVLRWEAHKYKIFEFSSPPSPRHSYHGKGAHGNLYDTKFSINSIISLQVWDSRKLLLDTCEYFLEFSKLDLLSGILSDSGKPRPHGLETCGHTQETRIDGHFRNCDRQINIWTEI